MAQQVAKIPGLTYLQANGSYSGSYQGMRWRVWVDAQRFRAAAWPEPWSFAKANEKEKLFADFEANEQGLSQAEQWLEHQYEAQASYWKAAAERPIF